MDLLTASARVVGDSAAAEHDSAAVEHELVVLQIAAKSPGIERRPFWSTWVLAGAESDEVVLTDVFVPDKMAIFPEQLDGAMDPLHARGFIWFELLICASYVGIASGLVERVIGSAKSSPRDRVALAVELETAMAALERVAGALDRGEEVDLGAVLLVRFGVQQAIERASMQAAAAVGGMGFIGSSDVAYLLAAARALAYHPPSLATATEPLDRYLAGKPLALD